MKMIMSAAILAGLMAGFAQAGFTTVDERQALPRSMSFEQALPRSGHDEFRDALPRSSNDDFRTALPRAGGYIDDQRLALP